MKECLRCGAPTRHVNPAARAQGKGKYCSKECYYAHKRERYSGNGHNRNGKHSPTYKVWHGMKQRCLNPNHSNFERYGGRGVRVCDRWHVFENFLADMGERPEKMTLDRIDPDGDYKPENCRWASMKVQCNNWGRSHQFIVRYKGEEYTLQELADKFGLDRYTLRRRITTSKWPEDMWHLPPDRNLRPNKFISDSEQERKVIPRGRV